MVHQPTAGSSKGKDRAGSLASDIAHFSINDSLAVLSPALPRVPSTRDLSDETHQDLDAAVLKGFKSDVKFNQEPDLASLLVNIVVNDRRLSSIPLEEAEELLEREPALTTMLQKAWSDRSFKEVRRLRTFL